MSESDLVAATDDHMWWALWYAAHRAKEGIKKANADLHRHTDVLEAVTAHAENHGWTLDYKPKGPL